MYLWDRYGIQEDTDPDAMDQSREIEYNAEGLPAYPFAMAVAP